MKPRKATQSKKANKLKGIVVPKNEDAQDQAKDKATVARYGIYTFHPFMGRRHDRKRNADDPIPMNFSCNVTEIGGELYSNMIQPMLKVFERFDLVPCISEPEKPVLVKDYVRQHKKGPLRFFGIFTEIPRDLLEFCQKHKLTFRIHEWPTEDTTSNYRVHTFLPHESNTVYSSHSTIDGKGWINAEQFRKCMINQEPPNEGYFAAHEKPVPDFTVTSW